MTSTLPVTIICGFLGAGKTTLVNHLLHEPGEERLGVLVNDFGAINIDRELIKVETKNQIELSNGCVCCSIQDDLASGLIMLSRMPSRFTRIVVECSGISHPAGVLTVFDGPAVSRLFHVDGLFCVVDASSFSDLDYQSTELAIDQAALSDIVLLNKVDIVEAAAVAGIKKTLWDAQPQMRLVDVVRAQLPADVLFGPHGRVAGRTASTSGQTVPKKAPHCAEYESLSLAWENPIRLTDFRRFGELLPSNILRGKGVLSLTTEDDQPRRAVFQLVGKRSSVTFESGLAPNTSQLVLIAPEDTLDRQAIKVALQSCPGARAVLPPIRSGQRRAPLICD